MKNNQSGKTELLDYTLLHLGLFMPVQGISLHGPAENVLDLQDGLDICLITGFFLVFQQLVQVVTSE